MGYGNETNISVCCLEDLPGVVNTDSVPANSPPKYRLQTENATAFGLLIRLFNAHKVPYKIEGECIIIAEPKP